MANKTGIEWTDATWNPVTGCAEVSPGCDHCYAKTFAERWRGTPGHYFENGFDVQLRPDKLDLPLRWKKPRRIFVNSMSDLFHDAVSDDFIAKVFAIMALAPQHTFQVLTKRHARMRSLLNSNTFLTEVCEHGEHFARLWKPGLDDRIFRRGPYPLPNVWLGVSTENQQWADIRIPALLDTPAAIRFVSAEPLLGPIELYDNGYLAPDEFYRDGIEWVIVGGESGRGARPMHPDWARSLLNQCADADVPFLFKQWGEYVPWYPTRNGQPAEWGTRPADAMVDSATGEVAEVGADVASGSWAHVWRVGKKAAGRELDGHTWDLYPVVEAAEALLDG